MIKFWQEFLGYNEFCEYAKLYYAQDYEMSSALAKDIAEENKLLKIREENEKRTHLNNLRYIDVHTDFYSNVVLNYVQAFTSYLH